MYRFVPLRSLLGPALAAIFLGAILAGSAGAHPGHGESNDLVSGWWHPLGGLDHLAAAVAVGILAAARGRSATWLLPLAFVLSMTLGIALGTARLTIPGTEVVLEASVLVLGLFLLSGKNMSLRLTVPLVGGIALIHGQAHGSELAGPSFVPAALGLIASTALMHLAGLLLAMACRRADRPQLIRWAGGVCAVVGVGLCCAGCLGG